MLENAAGMVPLNLLCEKATSVSAGGSRAGSGPVRLLLSNRKSSRLLPVWSQSALMAPNTEQLARLSVLSFVPSLQAGGMLLARLLFWRLNSCSWSGSSHPFGQGMAPCSPKAFSSLYARRAQRLKQQQLGLRARLLPQSDAPLHVCHRTIAGTGDP
jgi:hypothetical protein